MLYGISRLKLVEYLPWPIRNSRRSRQGRGDLNLNMGKILDGILQQFLL